MKSIFLVILGIIVVVGIVVSIRLAARHLHFEIPSNTKINAKSMTFDSTPDLPKGFGYKCQWYAIKTTDMNGVVEYLKLKDIKTANWKTGIEGAYEGYYFVSPPIHGWTLVVNALLPDLSDKGEAGPIKIIQGLSNKYGEAYYFGSHRVANYYAWAKAVQGEVTRLFGYADGGEIEISGNITPEEKHLGLSFIKDSEIPDEENVIEIAKKWTVSPLMDGGVDEYKTGTGLIGTP